ncbi:MAG: M14 family zinc carboxypeptidase [Planctomycetota bacterium]
MRRSVLLCLTSLVAVPAVGQLQAAGDVNVVADPVAAADIGVTQPGDAVVRVVPGSAERLGRVLELTRRIWSERVGRGPIEVQVSSAALATLRAEGFEPEVLIPDVQAVIDAERASIEARRFAGRADAVDLRTYYPFEDMIAFVNQLAAERPDLVSVQSIGQSVEGREIWTMTVTAPGDASGRADVVFNSLIHAREWITGPATLELARQLVRGYGSDPRITSILDQTVVHITPVLNPDGYVYAWTTDRFWRKNRRNNNNGSFGVDLNRNFDIDFGGNGASGVTTSDIYHGPGPFSEPESQAIRDFMLGLPDLRAHVDTHSFSQLILYSPGTFAQTVPDFARLAEVGAGITQSIQDVFGAFYTPQPGLDLYEAAGTFGDWSYDEFRELSYTFELRPVSSNPGFAPPDFFIRPTAEEISAAYLYLTERAVAPLRFVMTPPAVIRADEPTTVTFSVLDGTAAPSSTVRAFARPDENAAYSELTVQPLGQGRYAVTLESGACGGVAGLYFEALTTAGDTATFPAAGAAGPIAVPVTADARVFIDSFNTDQGWTVTNDPGLTDGAWERAIPNDTGTRGEPFADAERTGWAFVTDNAVGNADVDGGTTTLTSPALDATGGTGALLRYSLWLDNTRGSAPQEDALRVELSADNGQSWTPVDQIGPAGPDAAGGWVQREVNVGLTVGQTDSLRVRFIAEDLINGSVVEAGVDAVSLTITDGCPSLDPCDVADVNNDGSVNDSDFFAWVTAFTTGGPGCDQNGDGDCSDSDFFAWVTVFTSGC